MTITVCMTGESVVGLGGDGAGAGAEVVAGCDGGGGGGRDGATATGAEDAAGISATGVETTDAADEAATIWLATTAGAGDPLSWYTLRELTSQYASLKALGLFCTKSVQVPPCVAAQLLPPHALPAQAPQNVLSKTIWLLEKCWSKSQPEKWL